MNKSVWWPSAENIIKAQEQHSCAMLRVRRWVIMLRFWTSGKNYRRPMQQRLSQCWKHSPSMKFFLSGVALLLAFSQLTTLGNALTMDGFVFPGNLEGISAF